MITLNTIVKTYGSGSASVQALRGVSLTIEQGEFIAIMGASGSGKSTLLHLLGFLDQPTAGNYFLFGEDISRVSEERLAILRNRIAGFVFQQFHLLPRLNALENTELPLIYAGQRNAQHIAKEKLTAVGLAHRIDHEPNEMSGGERQRVAIARALVNDPAIIFADEPTGNLDTKSEAEIMNVLTELNKSGKTIIMVTHEQEVAAYASRIIRMRDGVIIADERQRDHFHSTEKAPTLSAILAPALSNKAQAELADHIKQSLRSITANKLRSLLSMLGILIGVASVIAMLALGAGATASLEKNFSSLGTNLLMVRPGSARVMGVAMDSGQAIRFTLQDAEALRTLTSIKQLSPSLRSRAQLVYNNNNWSSQIQGASLDYAAMRSATPTLGRFFTQQEDQQRKRVAVIGLTVATNLFGESNPLHKTIKINRIPFEVIGVLPEKGSNGFSDQDDIVIIPISTAMYRVMGKDYIDGIDVEALNPQSLDQAQEDIKNLINKKHKLNANNEAYQIRNMADMQNALKSTTTTMGILLGVIAGISLLVGGIGIMNIMLVSVTERTREIGLRKAIGARKEDILQQFLIESITMTLIGGIAGVILGTSIAGLISLLLQWTTLVSPLSIIISLGFSVGVGVGFGLWPARQAAQLNPVEALRYE